MQCWKEQRTWQKKNIAGVKTYRSLEALLADDAIELVIVNSPNATHYEYAAQALNAGKHVIVEKPFTITSKEAEDLIAIAKRNNKKLSVYHNRRYDSDYKTIKKIVEQNMLGHIAEAEMHFDRYKEELSPKKHKEAPQPGNGTLYDLGSHLIDQALQLFGMPEAVFADITIMRPISQVDDYFEVLLYYYKNKQRVRLHSSYAVREPLPGYIFHGLKGSFIKPKTDVQETMLTAGDKPGTSDWGTEPETEKGFLHTEFEGKIIKEYIPSEQGNYGEFYDGIYNSIRHDAPLPVTAEDAMNVIKIIEVAYKSNASKCIVEL